jgi:hypothetical protein
VGYQVTDPNESLLLDLNFRTSLLESLDWDEIQFNSLLQYLQDNLDFTMQAPDELLTNIKVKYGSSAFNIIKKMFMEEYIMNGLYKIEGDYEH